MSDEAEKPNFKSLDEVCKQSLDRIIEHAESVIIIVTRYDVESDDSWACTYSRGNVYTSMGAVKDWIMRKEEATKVRQRRAMEE